MKNVRNTKTFERTAIAILLAATMTSALAQGNGNGQPTGQAGGAGTSNVVVTNTAAQPVPMKDMTNGAFQPFQYRSQSTFASSNNCSFVPVPAGKRLIIEQLSANAYVSNSVGTVTHAYIAAQSGGGTGTAWVPMTYVGNGAGPAPNTQVTQSVRLYADPGSNVTVCMERSLDINGNITGSIFYQISFSGSLVDVP